MARLRRLSPAAAQPASADGTPSASRARGRAATSAQPRIPGGRHRSRPSRRDAAAYPLGPAVNGPPARPGWDADQAVAALYHAHYRALTRLAALLVCDVAAAGEIVQAAFAAMHGAWRHLRDYEKAQAYLLRAVVIRARSHRAAGPAQPQAARAPGRTASRHPLASLFVTALHALPARQREALVFRYYAGLPDTQIAAAMGISAYAVTGHIGRGMTSLQAAHSSAAAISCTAARSFQHGSTKADPAIVRRLNRQADPCCDGDQRTRGE